MPKTKRAIGIYLEGQTLRFAVVRREQGNFRVEAADTRILNEPLSANPAAPLAAAEDPFGIDSLLKAGQTSSSGQSNIQVSLDLLERYGRSDDVFALASDTSPSEFIAFPSSEQPKRKDEWFSWARQRGIELTGKETPRVFSGESENDWVLFFSEVSPLQELFQEAANLAGENRLPIRLREDPRVCLLDAIALYSHPETDDIVTLLHRDGNGSHLVQLKGRNLHIWITLPPGSWEEAVHEPLLGESAFRETSTFLLSGTWEKALIELFLKKEFPSARVKALSIFSWDDKIASTDSKEAFVIPVTLAAKALSRGDPRFYPVPKLKDSAGRSRVLLELSIAGIALVLFALLMGGVSTAKYLRQSREFSVLTTQIVKLQEMTRSQMMEQNSYRAQPREAVTQNKTLDSLLSTTKPLEPVLDTLCMRGRKIGNFWLTDLDWSYSDMTVSGVALRRERVDDIARILSGARLMSVATQELGRRTVYSFALTIPLSSDK